MKPIKLEIQGIHSFIDKQVFDFENISGNKMFGIFGPTGSGKSTVLDAIVLALYGDVWRSKSKSDFINLKAKKAKVVFTFSCIEKGKNKVYEVERTFNINKDGDALQKAQVFDCSGINKTQVVEGASKVDLFLTQLIGLTANEFSKCIALPQGEFAGFLKAKPNERIAIVGGIFDLNKYGEEIAEKVKRRISERKNELTAITSQMEVYAGINQNEIDDLTVAYNNLKKEISEDEKLLANYEKTIREEEDLAVLQAEYDKVTSMLSNVLSEGVNIADKRLRISRAKKINDCESLIETVADLRTSINEDEVKIKELQEIVDGERINLGGVIEDNKHRVEVLESTIKILLDKHIGLENAKNDSIKLGKLKTLQTSLMQKSENIELQKAKVLQEKYTSENLLQNHQKAYEEKVAERDCIDDELVQYDDVVGYRLLERHRKFVENHIKFLDVKINKALNMKTKATEKINETIAKEEEAKKDLYTLRLEIAHGNDEIKIDDSTIKDELYKKMSLLNKLNVTEEYIVNLQSKIESLKADNDRRRTLIGELESEKAIKYKTYVSHVNELNQSKVNFDSIIKNRLDVASKNAVAEFTDNYKVGDVCPICNAEIMTKNVMAKLSSVVIEQQLETAKDSLDKYNQRRVDELYVIAKLEQSISNHKAEISENEKEITRLDKEIISKCSKLLNKRGARLSDLNVVQLQVKNEIANINKSLAKESKLLDKINATQIDKIKYNTAFVTAGDKCADYSELLESLVEDKLKVESQMEAIDGDVGIEVREAKRKELIKRKNSTINEIETLHDNIVKMQNKLMELSEQCAKLSLDGDSMIKELKTTTDGIEELKEQLKDFESVVDFDDEMYKVKSKIDSSREEIERCNATSFKFANKIAESENKLFSMRQINETHKSLFESTNNKLIENFAQVQIDSLDNLEVYKLSAKEISEIEEFIGSYDSNLAIYNDRKMELEEKINGRVVTPNIVQEIQEKAISLESQINKKREDYGRMTEVITSKKFSLKAYQQLEKDYQNVSKKLDLETELSDLLRGKALLEYVAEEFIDDIAYMASAKLQELMDGQYVLKYKNKEFYVLDNFNDGSERNVNTLSGGEIFVVSLALALSISDALMSRSDKRIDFFFLDEGFGTLDKEYCEYIVNSLNKLSSSTMTIGLISHIPELQEKIKKKFVIEKATERSGSKVRYTETY